MIYPMRLGFRQYFCSGGVVYRDVDKGREQDAEALKFLAIVRLLLVISPSQNKNMTRTKYLNPKRFGYIGA